MLRKIATFGAVLMLCGCGGGGGSNAEVEKIPAPTTSSALPAAGLLQNLLTSTANDYLAALLSGNALGVSAYLAPACRAKTKGNPANNAGLVKSTAAGATVTVAAVDVQGNTGAITAYTYSANAPAALKPLIESARAGTHPWVYVNREWALTC
jgi:hypothetical protein